jgi:N utilization substance protein B
LTDQKDSKISIKKGARKRAFYFIFESLVRDIDNINLFYEKRLELHPEDNQYCIEVIQYVADNKQSLLDLIDSKAKNWKTNRMPKADLALLLVAEAEFAIDKIDKTIVKEQIVDLAKDFGGSDNSYNFILGILS